MAEEETLKKYLVILVVMVLLLTTIQPCWAGGRWYHGGHYRHGGGGIGPGAAIGLGLGAFALGTIAGAIAAQPQAPYGPPLMGYEWRVQTRLVPGPYGWINQPYYFLVPVCPAPYYPY
ncbi:MAG: hypothetical protein A3J76_05825 [Candidatus Moranbacteria bacterium RBG_13_45_13]|nr:MAG: hypothetical protein A3J76_05825 [Candidatus Moranbacteria bacterium RBG_13_45_13]